MAQSASWHSIAARLWKSQRSTKTLQIIVSMNNAFDVFVCHALVHVHVLVHVLVPAHLLLLVHLLVLVHVLVHVHAFVRESFS